MESAVTFVTWNIDQAKREEAFAETRFDVRWPAIKEQIAQCNADILCLQELRNLETSSINVARILYEIAELGYDYKHAYYGASQFSFALATFYKRERFFVSACRVVTLPVDGRIVLTLRLRTVDKREFYVCNTHFSLEEKEKETCARWLADYLQTLKPSPFLTAGDYNFFDDRDGGAHRQILLDVAYDAIYPLENASGTFMGYEHDAFKQPYEAMSRLDHVFYNQIQIERAAYAYGDMEQVKKRTYPSDHLMISFDFSLM